MNISELLNKTGWKLLTEESDVDSIIHGVYCGDLLSWVMGRGKPMQAWVTVQAHRNILAVASLREFSCIILADNALADDYLIETAQDENVVLISSDIPVYETCKKLVELGL